MNQLATTDRFTSDLQAAIAAVTRIAEQIQDAGLRLATVDLNNAYEMERRRVEELQRQVETDKLTGLLERFSFKERLSATIAEDRRSHGKRGSVCVLFGDIDSFKKYNEIYGHTAGDRCIAAVGRCLLDHLRPTDYTGCRIGGDEFAIMLPGVSVEQARAVAERLIGAVADLKLEHKGAADGTVTLSMGVAELSDSDSVEEILLRADMAMYKAKSAGKNQVKTG